MTSPDRWNSSSSLLFSDANLTITGVSTLLDPALLNTLLPTSDDAVSAFETTLFVRYR